MSMVSSVVGGVDTHADVHVAAALDENGAVLGIESFPVNEAGYRRLAEWLAGFGPVVKVGVEGTGSYGVGLARHLHREGHRGGGGGSAESSEAPPVGEVGSDRRRGCSTWRPVRGSYDDTEVA